LLAGENRYSILTDHLGAPVAMADAEGRESWSADLDLYGARVSGTGHASLCPFRFPGQYEDAETGLHYNRHRYYDPDAGLYISEDPIGLEGTGFNLRAYVRDPLTQFDPFGLECWNSARKKYWKKEAKRNPGKYSKANLARMKDGKAPRMRVVVTDRVTGKKKTKDVSMELHHKKIPQRVGGKDVHKASNLKKVTPWEHAEEDEFRHAGDPLHHVVNGVDTWKP
jgi:RHS repeat-associated protein